MCKYGDIILVDSYMTEDGVDMTRHSFIVVDDREGTIRGLPYNIIANVMSSIKNESHRNKVLRYASNMEITAADRNCSPENGKDAYIKADQLYYFDTSKIQYTVIGYVAEEVMDRLMDLMEYIDDSYGLTINAKNL